MFKKKPQYKSYNSHRRIMRRLLILASVLLAILAIGSFVVHQMYNEDLQPVSTDNTLQYVTIASGTPPSDIAELLHDKGLIRSVDAFQWYITSRNIRDKLQAGTYQFSPSQSTPQIANAIAKGKVATDLFTIVPGQTIAEIRKALIVAGFKVTEVDAALRPEAYAGHPALADSPAGVSLEGFLYPDSYQKNADTHPQEIIARSLGEMQKHVTPVLRQRFAAQGLTVHQAVTMASIIEKEVSNPAERTQVAQVFYKRLRTDMRLGSDVTVFYARSINDQAYDTTEVKGLPPGPIAAISEGSLQAVANPAGTDWVYFVTGDDGTTHFSKTFAEHQALIARYCHQKCKQ